MPAHRTRRSSPPLVALFSANPSCLTTLDLEGEVRAIIEELGDTGLEGVLQFEVLSATTPRTVQRSLLVEQPTVVQFSGHGRGTRTSSPPRKRRASSRNLVPDPAPAEATGILLHSDRGAALEVVSGKALGNLFAKVSSSVRLVFLNACHSAEQADAIIEHVDFVIGIDGAISDEAATAFAVALYRALAIGRTIKEAFELGVNALMLAGLEADQERPILRARRGVDPGSTRFVAAPRPDDGKAWDVFISYAAADRTLVRELAEELHHRHLRVFFDEWEIGPGEEVRRRLEQGLDESTHGIVAVSPSTMSRPWVQAEYSALVDNAMTRGVLLIPVLIGQGDAELPLFLRARQPVDLRGESPEGFRERVGTVARAIRGQRPGPPSRLRRRGRVDR